MAALTLTLVALLACVLAPAAAQVGAYGWAFGGDFLIANTDVGSAALYQNGTYHALGGGMAYTSEGMRTYQDVSVILEYDDGLYVAGRFADHGLRGIGQWDGKKWDNLRGGFTGGCEVTALAAHGDFIFVGVDGVCNTTSGVTISGVGSYSRATGWSNMAGGVEGPALGPSAASASISSLTVLPHLQLLAVGGLFTSAGALKANLIAFWNVTAAAWSPLSAQSLALALLPDECAPTPASCWNPSTVSAVAANGSKVVIGGAFTAPAVASPFNVLLWTEAGFASLPPPPYPLASPPSSLLVATDGAIYAAVGADVLVLPPDASEWTSLKTISTVFAWPLVAISQLYLDAMGSLYAFGQMPAGMAVLVFGPATELNETAYSYTNASRWGIVVAPSLSNTADAVSAATPVLRDYAPPLTKEEPLSRVFLTGLVCATVGFVAGGMLFFAGRCSAQASKGQYERI